MCCGGERYRTGSEAASAVDQRKRVRIIVDSVCGCGEFRSSVNVDIDDGGRCGCQYREEGPGMCCCRESYWTGSEAAALAEQRASVRVVVDNVCVGREVRSSANVDVDNNVRCSYR